jgi:hypothetical protein
MSICRLPALPVPRALLGLSVFVNRNPSMTNNGCPLPENDVSPRMTTRAPAPGRPLDEHAHAGGLSASACMIEAPAPSRAFPS